MAFEAAKARENLKFIKAHKANWDQTFWVIGDSYDKGEKTEEELIQCGTGGCYAGWYALRHAPKGTSFGSYEMRLPEKEDTAYSEFLSRELDLDFEQTDTLTASYNSLIDIENLINLFEQYPDTWQNHFSHDYDEEEYYD